MEKNIIIPIKNSWERKFRWKGRVIRRKDIVDMAMKMGQLGKGYIQAVALPVSQQEWQEHQSIKTAVCFYCLFSVLGKMQDNILIALRKQRVWSHLVTNENTNHHLGLNNLYSVHGCVVWMLCLVQKLKFMCCDELRKMLKRKIRWLQCFLSTRKTFYSVYLSRK